MIWETEITRQQPHTITLSTPSDNDYVRGAIESTSRAGPGCKAFEVGLTLACVLENHGLVGQPFEVLAAAITRLADANTADLSGADHDLAMAADVYLESLKPPSAER